jgi:murein DD-endopeptidase MepM/ murein hydrolase activator NlpD
MTRTILRFMLCGAFALTAAAEAPAANRIVRFQSREIARPDTSATARSRARAAQSNAASASDVPVTPARPFLVYPIAGTVGGDLHVPYFVDLDPFSALRDFDCGERTFAGHTGHDAYLRSFREQDIGVPVFAPLDGVVAEIHDGEPDHNTDDDPDSASNLIVIDHGDGQKTMFTHLRKGSITVQAGQVVTAGTQIALVGSSGQSVAPHLHFETQLGGRPFEPMSGPCRAGDSAFRRQPAAANAPVVLGAALSDRSFDDFRPAPWDDAPRRATFAKGANRLWFRTELGNVPAGTTYEIRVVPPAGNAFSVGRGELDGYEVHVGSFGWGMDLDLYATGMWKLALLLDDREIAALPFEVVVPGTTLENHPPHSPQVQLGPVAVLTGRPAICRVTPMLVADPDYDVVSYGYEWRVGGVLVRSVTSAATTDVLAREHLIDGADVSCTVTARDGVASSEAVMASALVSDGKTRAARR